jgi:transketolase C-terminal domain/subunit
MVAPRKETEMKKIAIIAAAMVLSGSANAAIVFGDLTITKNVPNVKIFRTLDECKTASVSAITTLQLQGGSYYSVYCNVITKFRNGTAHNVAWGFYNGDWSIDRRWTK